LVFLDLGFFNRRLTLEANSEAKIISFRYLFTENNEKHTVRIQCICTARSHHNHINTYYLRKAFIF